MFRSLIRAAPLARRALSIAAAAAPRFVPRAKLAAAAVVGTVAAGTVAFAACAEEREWVQSRRAAVRTSQSLMLSHLQLPARERLQLPSSAQSDTALRGARM